MKFSEFAVAGDTEPIGITVTGDENAWFLTLHHVNKVTPGGAFTSFISVTGQDAGAPAMDPYSPQNDITVGPDKALWFTADNNDKAIANPLGCFGPPAPECNDLGRISSNAAPGTLADVVAVFDKDTQHQPPSLFPATGVVSGPNDEVWVESCFGATSADTDCPFGVYQSFKTDGTPDIRKQLPNLTQGVSFPQCPIGELYCGYNGMSIAQGSDKAIYIIGIFNTGNGLLPSSTVVFRINAQGTITNTFPVPDAMRIASGPDGNLWITQAGSTNAIARMTTSGAVTEFPLPTKNAQPLGITAGNDGAVWFTEFATSKIGRITTSGTITEYPTPTANSGPSGIASLQGECTTGHGRIWFTEASANKIGRVDF